MGIRTPKQDVVSKWTNELVKERECLANVWAT